MASYLGTSGIGPVVKFVVAFPIIYHFSSGLRHIYLERFPDGLTAETQYQYAAALFGWSTAASLATLLI